MYNELATLAERASALVDGNLIYEMDISRGENGGGDSGMGIPVGEKDFLDWSEKGRK